MKGLAFSKAATPVQAETSTISAKGENGLWDDDEAGSSVKERSSRARRELSVIDESSSIVREEDSNEAASSPETEEGASGSGPLADENAEVGGLATEERHDTEDELDEAEEEELPDQASPNAQDSEEKSTRSLDPEPGITT